MISPSVSERTQGLFSWQEPQKEGIPMALGDLILMIGMLLVFVGVMIFVGAIAIAYIVYRKKQESVKQ